MGYKEIHVDVRWTGNNYCCSWSNYEIGTVVVTNESLEELKADFAESLKWHIEGCVKDGDDVPEYLVKGHYKLCFDLSTTAQHINNEQ